MQLPSLPLFTSGTAKSGTFNQLRDVVAVLLNPPAAMIRASGTPQNITSGGSYQLVTFPTTEYDTEPDALVTSTSRLTVKTAGRYRVAATATFSANGSGDRYIQIRKNAGGSAAGGSQVVSATAKPSSGSSCTVSTNAALEVQLSVGDTLEAFVFQDSGATLTLNTGPGDTFLTVRLASATASLSSAAATNIGSALAETALGTSDLDSVKAPGSYVQANNADATLVRHYPEASVSGHLQVYSDGSGSPGLVVQVYRTYLTSGFKVWERHWVTAGGWGSWSQTNGGGGSSLVLPVMGGGFSMPGNLITSGSAEAYSNPIGPAGHFRGNLFRLLTTQTLTGIGCYISVAGTAGGTGRLGIYKWNSGSNWDLVIDAGTVAVDTTGSKVITVSQSLTPGVYSAGIAGSVNNFSTFDYKGSPTFMTQADGALAASAPQQPRWWISNPGPGTGVWPSTLSITPQFAFDGTTFMPVLVRFAQ